ncbi:hypothetical protein [Prosthecochloris vibrioformis]|uniref:Uncharacterized protein n=1 Tax=Prosthecochloris vibrioformis TaxID=1098 RepID=A0A5C4RT91_PROVB|nr:hypothetical protein [Prosthecochloris vibrioformis]TNJ34169.1 hypothetical protein FGF68_10035 [Prosthecochloris vibrioformis]
MKPSTTLTVHDVLGQKNIAEASKTMLEHKEAFEAVRNNASGKHRILRWKPVWGNVSRHAGKLLDIDITRILLKTWKKNLSLDKYSDTDAYPPDRTYLQPLIDHTITSWHKPALVLNVDGVINQTIDFEVYLLFKLRGFTLEIQNGRIMKIHTGNLGLKARMKCIMFILLDRDIRSVNLPKAIDLGEGVPISDLSAQRAPA